MSCCVQALIAPETLSEWLVGERMPSGLSGSSLGSRARELTLFSVNDYLGLSSHPDVRRAVADRVRAVGMGPRSSALISGFTEDHRELELLLADLKGTEDCLLFPSGWRLCRTLSYCRCPSVELHGHGFHSKWP